MGAFLKWLRDFFAMVAAWFGANPVPPVDDPPQEPPEEPPAEPEEPEEPQVPPDEPFAVVLHPHEWVVSGPWTIHDDHVEAVRQGDGGELDIITVTVPAGEYTLTTRVFAPDQSSDAFYLSVNDEVTRVFPRAWGEWATVTLPAGELEGRHRIGVGVGEAGLIIDAIAVTSATWTGSLEELLGMPPTLPEPEEPDEPTPEPEPEPEPDPQEPNVPPTNDPGLGDGIFNVAPIIDPTFNPATPTIRTSRALTSEERQYHDTFRAAFLNPASSQYTAPTRVFDSDSSYHLGRFGEPTQESALQTMSRTGDGGILDELVRAWRLAFGHLVIEWDARTATLKGDKHSYVENNAGARISNGRWVLDGRAPWSPHRKWLYRWGEPSGGRGTDLNNLQTIKPWAILARFLWALESNRGAPSPAGFDYGAEADRWKPVLRGFIDAYTSDTGADWEDNYRGLDAGPFGGGSRRRATPGEWPFYVRTEGHAIFNSLLLCYYCGLLGSRGWPVPNHAAAFPAADRIAEYIRESLVDSKDAKGRPSLLLPQGATIMKATYTAYPAWELAHMRDIGRWVDLFDDETLLRLSRSYEGMIKPDGSTLGDLAGGVDRTGHGYRVGHGDPRTPFQHAFNGFSLPMLWADNDYLFRTATAAQNSNGRWGGYGESALMHIVPAAQFLKLVGEGHD